MFDPSDCSTVRAAIGSMIDDELDAARRHRAEQHLAECSACSTYRDELLCLKQAVHDIPLPSAPSEGLWVTIETQMAAANGSGLRSPSADATTRRRFVLYPAWRSDALLAAAAFVLGLGLSFLMPRLIAGTRPLGIGQDVVTQALPVALAVGDFVRENASGSAPESFWARFAAVDSWRGAAESQLEFQPSFPDRLSGGYELTGVKLLKDKCCTTLYLHYESADDSLDVFQCHNDHPVEFGPVEARRGASDGIAYTKLRWDESGTEGRVVNRDDVNIIVVGSLGDQLADQITREFRNAIQ